MRTLAPITCKRNGAMWANWMASSSSRKCVYRAEVRGHRRPRHLSSLISTEIDGDLHHKNIIQCSCGLYRTQCLASCVAWLPHQAQHNFCFSTIFSILQHSLYWAGTCNHRSRSVRFMGSRALIHTAEAAAATATA